MTEEYPIFPKTYDLLLWLFQVTQGFPKSQRFVLAQRLQLCGLDFYERLIEARKVAVKPRREVLLRADVALETLRLELRLSHELRLLSLGQYQYVALQVTEVGRLLGSWRKKIESGNDGP